MATMIILLVYSDNHRNCATQGTCLQDLSYNLNSVNRDENVGDCK